MKEALKLALEALWTTANPKAEEAITAIKAALAQPAQEPIGKLILGGMIDTSEGLEYDDWDVELSRKTIDALQERLVTCDPVTLNIYTTPPAAQPAQEPVAWLEPEWREKICPEVGYEVTMTDDHPRDLCWIPLYTHPPQRTWVGLTEAQFLEAVRLAENGNYLVAFVRIQEWLKEKNT